jgi:GNAT superfamily N-acetyltransferase
MTGVMTVLLDADTTHGSAITLRRPTPADRDAIEAMYARCSRDSRYRRFHGAVPMLARSYLDAVTAGRPEVHDALIAVSGGTVIGLASAAPNGEPQTVEVGTLVEDAWQRHGVGRDLLLALLTAAACRGMRYVRFEVLYENGWLAEALARLLDEVEVEVEHDGAEISLLCRIPAS